MTAVQTEPGARHETVWRHDGQYTCPFVLPGGYRITVEAVRAGVYIRQPGPPLVWDNVVYVGGDLRPDPRTLDRAFDVTRFVSPTSSTFGQVLNRENLPRRIQVAPRLSW